MAGTPPSATGRALGKSNEYLLHVNRVVFRLSFLPFQPSRMRPPVNVKHLQHDPYLLSFVPLASR
eukprot:m.98196 g.98196  ORF g.98196 m.98196 type:complete len:65 (+) comp14860_c0_seq1:1763-1957(+)